jgi:GT2 family glycosyltransferase/O-antigen/teichoic acid export membrane protein
MVFPIKNWSPVALAMRRYGLASVGPFGSAAAQFLLTLAMLSALSPQDFGVLSFFLVVSQFSSLIWGALFGSPLPILVMNPDRKTVLTLFQATAGTCFCLTAASLAVFFGLGLLFAPANVAGVFAVFASLSLLRMFARASAYALGAPLVTVTSDLFYLATLLAGTTAIFRDGAKSLDAPLIVLSASVLVSFIPFIRLGAPRALLSLRFNDLRHYGAIWSEHASWSAAGVVAAEMVANAHVYVVTIFLGPAAFAPLSASSLVIRPLNVFMNALTDFDRPEFARLAGKHDLEAITRGVRRFETALAVAWLGTAALTVLVIVFFPKILRPSAYRFDDVVKALLIWMVVAGARTLRIAQNTFLQGAGEFRGLARITAISSVVSLVAVALLVATQSAVLSLLGVLAGEMTATALTRRELRVWRKVKEMAWKADRDDEAPHGDAAQAPETTPATTQVRLAVGVKALNEERHIAAAIESSLEAARPFGGVVVLADCGSSDRTVEIASSYPIKIVQLADPTEKSCGSGAQLAFQSADCDFFYLLDGDMQLEPAFLPAAVKFLVENPQHAGVGGQIVETNLDGCDFRIRSLRSRPMANGTSYEVDRLDCGGLYRTQAIRDVGYFADKNLHAFEEFDLAARLATRGWRLARLNTTSLLHHGHADNSYRLLWKRLRSGYASGAGEVLRAAIGQPHLPYVISRLSHLRHGALVVAWWALLALALFMPADPAWRLAMLAFLILSPVAFLAVRRRSLPLGVYCVAAWNISALGTIAGIARPRRPTETKLGATAVWLDDARLDARLETVN